MNGIEKVYAAQQAAKHYRITGKGLAHSYLHGENPWADMQIENAVFCDMFPEEVPDKGNYFGFDRTDYTLEKI